LFVGSDDLSFIEDAPFHGREEFILAQARWCIEFGAWGVKVEMVEMTTVASGRHTAAVTRPAEIVLAL
jgi:hypothetical protein